MAIQETVGSACIRAGWLFYGAEGKWKKRLANGDVVIFDTPEAAWRREVQWADERRAIARAKVPRWHWGLDIGTILESIPYPR